MRLTLLTAIWRPLLKKWLKVNPSDYVLISSNNKPLSSSQITRMLNDVFGKKVSVNMLRHIYLTNYYKDVPPIKDMEKIAGKMVSKLHWSM